MTSSESMDKGMMKSALAIQSFSKNCQYFPSSVLDPFHQLPHLFLFKSITKMK